MFAYIIRRLLLIVPTLIGIMLINFVVTNMAPGGPIDELIARLQSDRPGGQSSARDRAGAGEGSDVQSGQSRGARGLDPALLDKLRKQLNLDKPLGERFLLMMAQYASLDFGESFFQNRSVIDLVVDKLPVSISLGVWTTLIMYLLSIPLGIRKAVRDGTRFDVYTSGLVVVGNAIPSFMFGVLLIILFASGNFLDIFPLRGLTSDDWDQLSLLGKIGDYLWHITLPVTALVISGFAYLTLLTKNSFLEEINKQYVTTARAKGLAPRRVLYGHVFRNAMLLIIASFPAALIEMLFTGSFLIEVMFSLDGIGRLGYESVINRDYPVLFGTLFMFSLLGLVLRLITDLTYAFVDPRIDFGSREV